MWAILANAWALVNTEMDRLATQAPHKAPEDTFKSFGWIERVLAEYGWTAECSTLKFESSMHPMFVSEVDALSHVAAELKKQYPPTNQAAA